MPSSMSFDPFRRFRRRRPPPPSSSEEDSEASSHERDQPHIIHFVTSKSGHRSAEPLVIAPDNGRRPREPPKTLAEDTHITFSLGKAPRTSERPSKTSLQPASASDSIDAPQPPVKSSLMRRVTSKFNISIPSKSNPHLRSRPSTRTLPADMTPRAAISVSPTLPNSFISKERREAALRERGLLPPRKDLSEQEREADQRLGCTHVPTSIPRDGVSEAERLKVNWLAVNRTSEGSASDGESPRWQGTKNRSQSVLASPSSSALSDMDASRRSGEGGTDLLSVGRPSISSSVPPLSTSSHLEVLHEDPSEQGLIPSLAPLSSANPPIVVSTVLDYPSSPILVESPTSYTYPSQCAGSLLSSLSQSDASPVPEKENARLPVSRRRTNDSGDRGRRAVRPSLSNLGTRSLSNLRRSVAGSLWLPSSSTLSSTDLHPTPHPVVQAPRTAISPTIHSLGSIIRETRYIKDVESRRLSELAFLD